MELALKKLFSIMPFLFGIGFIAPLIAQTMTYWGLQGPLGLSNLAVGLLIGAPWGLYANIRGRWL
ncbi:MAG: hypothetical protein WA842_00405 [Croceibacterium sp.]